LFGGGKLVTTGQRAFDPVELWELVDRERVNRLVFVGDASGWPLAETLAANPDQFNTTSLQVVGSGGSVLSPALKQWFLELLPSIILAEAFGSSETGGQGVGVSVTGALSIPLRFAVDDATAVLDDELRRVASGSGVIGRIARRGRVPLRYLNDEARTAATFVEVDGERWALTGDMATVEADGTIALLGRGSACINTGGEKVYPEEVESVLKEHSSVGDAIVVGVPDARWGEQVAAIVASKVGHRTTLAELDAHCRGRLAPYKIPRQLFPVDTIERSPSGKPDYAWAKTVVASR
jgi:acyl-CoA synthetase (AMP-forming)/AMP-acid ligase II